MADVEMPTSVNFVTVAVAVKVFDGIVLATDSATTLELSTGSHQVWNGANKIFQLHRLKPVAAMTWGLGSIGSASISTLAKDLRRRLMGGDRDRPDWELGDDYTVEQVAERLIEMMFDELYAPLVSGTDNTLGFLVAGFSGTDRAAEAWLVTLEDPVVRPAPELQVGQTQSGWLAYAQKSAVERLFNGFDQSLVAALAGAVPATQQVALVSALTAQQRQPAHPAMPLADAIGLARFLVDVTVGYSRYLLGPDTVGGPTEVAAISRHEGFKWISRKHYYSAELNPGDPGHDY